jgi:hypothetical protein
MAINETSKNASDKKYTESYVSKAILLPMW